MSTDFPGGAGSCSFSPSPLSTRCQQAPLSSSLAAKAGTVSTMSIADGHVTVQRVQASAAAAADDCGGTSSNSRFSAIAETNASSMMAPTPPTTFGAKSPVHGWSARPSLSPHLSVDTPSAGKISLFRANIKFLF